MFFEYALDPAAVATWHTPDRARYFKGEFADDSGRLVAQFPGTWVRMVRDEFLKLEPVDGPDSARWDSTKSMMFEFLMTHLKPRLVSRGRLWPDHGSCWLQRALEADRAVPFHAIVSNVARKPKVISHEDLEFKPEPLWEIPKSMASPSDPEGLVLPLGQLLEISRQIVFVDPHFSPRQKNTAVFLRLMLGALKGRAGLDRPTCGLRMALTRDPWARKPRDQRCDEFVDSCREVLPRFVPEGWKIDCHLICEKEGGQEIHNRYVLTELGGVMYGKGLDESPGNTSDDIARLSEENRQLRWKQYVDDEKGTFEIERRLEVEGRLRLRQGENG